MMHIDKRYHSINVVKKIRPVLTASLVTASLMLAVSACSEKQPDPRTLHFTTRDNIKTTLDLDLEMYVADEIADLYYINFRYYTRNASGQWTHSASPEGPWTSFRDQKSIPQGLLYLQPK